MKLKWKWWDKDDEPPVFGVPDDKLGRLRHYMRNGCGGVSVEGSPEEVAERFNTVTAAEIYFDQPGIQITPSDVRRGRGEL